MGLDSFGDIRSGGTGDAAVAGNAGDFQKDGSVTGYVPSSRSHVSTGA